MKAAIHGKRGLLRRALLAWYRREARQLSWRGTTDPYAIWISEIILQQTRVDQATPYIERFMEAFPTVTKLAAAKEDHVLKLWEGLGYYARARNLRHAAKRIVSEQGGELPKTAAQWKTLPGVGPYTAGAIASIAYGEQCPVLDGNVKRVLARLADLEACIDDTATVNTLWEWADWLVKGASPGDFNQGLMELGARVCTPKRPNCQACPIAKFCAANAAGTQELRPIRRKKKPIPHHERVVAAIKRNGRYLLGKRPSDGFLGGLWEFPGAGVAQGETHQAALERIVEETLGLEVEIGGLVATVDHAYSHFKVTLNVYACTSPAGTPKPQFHTQLKWIPKSQFPRYAFPGANQKFLKLL